MTRRRIRPSNGLYRSRKGVLFGVCRGLADYFDLKVVWIRMLAVVLLIMTGLWPMTGIYLVAALVMKPEPVRPIHNDDEREFYHSYVHSPEGAAQRIRRRAQDLERRIRRLEDSVTSREFDWDRRIRE
jgi:phage shock protein C